MKKRKIMVAALWIGSMVAHEPSANASGHGPVFALATPTNARGGWSLDLGVMGRTGAPDTGVMSRSMLSYGLSQDVQVSFSLPAVFQSAPLAPGRETGMMPASGDFEGIAAWRFHRRGRDIGLRFESTAYAGLVVPGPQKGAGLMGTLRNAPGIWAAVDTGFASRSHYLWAGAGYTRFAESKGDRRPGLLFYSLVWGYRPPSWRKEYPHWDWRWFVELTGDDFSRVRHRGTRMPDTGGHQIFIGPTMLGIYKNYAIEGGIQVPMFRSVGRWYEREKFRFAVNVSYFF